MPVYPALRAAAGLGRIEEVTRLLAEGADFQERGGVMESSPLIEATFHGHEDVVVLLLEKGAGAGVFDRDKHGMTSLHMTAHTGHLAIVRLLLEHGADVSARSNIGLTPLHHAVCHGHRSVVQHLLDKGADVSATTNTGMTPEDLLATNRLQIPANRLQIAAMLKAALLRRAQCEAFAMGQQERLGAESWVRGLDVGVVRMVLEQV